MAEYYGLKAISKRMGYKSQASIYRSLLPHGFPMFRKRRPGSPRFTQCPWYTNDDMILAWELSQAKIQCEAFQSECEEKDNWMAKAWHRQRIAQGSRLVKTRIGMHSGPKKPKKPKEAEANVG